MGDAEQGTSAGAEPGYSVLSQRQLAALVYVDHSLINRLEQGSRRPNPAVARRLGEVLGAVEELGKLAARTEGPGRPAPEPAWPRRFGAVPAVAESFQERTAAQEPRSMWSDDAAEGSNAESAVRTLVLAGPGGVGKSQLAAQLARERWDAGAVDLLMWVTAESRQAVGRAVRARRRGRRGRRARRPGGGGQGVRGLAGLDAAPLAPGPRRRRGPGRSPGPVAAAARLRPRGRDDPPPGRGAERARAGRCSTWGCSGGRKPSAT